MSGEERAGGRHGSLTEGSSCGCGEIAKTGSQKGKQATTISGYNRAMALFIRSYMLFPYIVAFVARAMLLTVLSCKRLPISVRVWVGVQRRTQFQHFAMEINVCNLHHQPKAIRLSRSVGCISAYE